jgi:hypothetical protein
MIVMTSIEVNSCEGEVKDDVVIKANGGILARTCF